MNGEVDARCIVCPLVFCCAECRKKHERSVHGLQYDCPICREKSYLCRPDELNPSFLKHLSEEHLPLQCKKCDKFFYRMEDFKNIDNCNSISELVDDAIKVKDVFKDIDEKFNDMYEKSNDDESTVSVNKYNKTAVITPIMRKNVLVDYESSDTEAEGSPKITTFNQSKLAPKTPVISKRAATPHVKKLMRLIRQKIIIEEDDEDTVYDNNLNNTQSDTKNSIRTPNRIENDIEIEGEMLTPTSHIPHLTKLLQTVTTSTPTQGGVDTEGWSLFENQGADSPLSEIENTESPGQSIDTDKSKSESMSLVPKLKSIIVNNSRGRVGSQDSSEKQVTSQDSVDTTEASSIKKKVKFAEDTVFENETKIKRVFRKPKRMLTPGPQKPRFSCNPRFQALLNRFENQGMTVARTPINSYKDMMSETTPPLAEFTNMPARAINFKDESPVVESGNYSKESNELFKTCIEPSESSDINNAITALAVNLAGSLHNCLNTALKTNERETEIQLQFVITKKKISNEIVDGTEGTEEVFNKIEGDMNLKKDNIWTSVTRAVKNVFWKESEKIVTTTPHRSSTSSSNESSSSGKRKFDDMMDPGSSPLNHKRHKYSYEGRIKGRPPLPRCAHRGVSMLRTKRSTEQPSTKLAREEMLNQSL